MYDIAVSGELCSCTVGGIGDKAVGDYVNSSERKPKRECMISWLAESYVPAPSAAIEDCN
jgi:hypothetical protein